MGGWWMGAGSLVFIALIVLVVLLFVRHPDEPGNSRATRDAADILAERFAAGEIDEGEYRSRLAALRRHGQVA
jgi:putative membrane protein